MPDPWSTASSVGRLGGLFAADCAGCCCAAVAASCTASPLCSVSGGLSSLASAFSGRSTSQKPTIATTGIRGLSTEDLKNANPDAEALKRMQSYRADRPAAERFAREGKLIEASVDYQAGGRR